MADNRPRMRPHQIFGGPPSGQRPCRAGPARRAPAEAERRRDRLPTHAHGSALTSTSADVVMARAPPLLPSLSFSSQRSRRDVSLAITPNIHKQQRLSVSASLRPAEQIPAPRGVGTSYHCEGTDAGRGHQRRKVSGGRRGRRSRMGPRLVAWDAEAPRRSGTIYPAVHFSVPR